MSSDDEDEVIEVADMILEDKDDSAVRGRRGSTGSVSRFGNN